MTASQTNRLSELLARIGRYASAREEIVAALVRWEARNQGDGEDLREEVTGPLVDALFRDVEWVTRQLTSGLVFTMPYRSKIVREFAMAPEPLSHVWEPQTTRLLVRLARRSKIVLVGGAYAGDHAIPIAQALAPRGGTFCPSCATRPSPSRVGTCRAATSRFFRPPRLPTRDQTPC